MPTVNPDRSRSPKRLHPFEKIHRIIVTAGTIGDLSCRI
jgi:hypothetical protein